MAETRMKWGYGQSANIAAAVSNGTLDTHDMVVTSDTDELVHIQAGGTLQYIKSRVPVYESVEAANAAITAADSKHYLGEQISVLNADGTYDVYTVSEGTGGTHIATRPEASGATVEWVEF